MTLGEIGSIMWAKRRDSEEAKDEQGLEQMYRKLQRMKGRTP